MEGVEFKTRFPDKKTRDESSSEIELWDSTVGGEV